MKKKERCEKCNKTINTKKDHCVLIATFNRISSPDHYAYYHFQCWVDLFNESIQKKFENNFKRVMDVIETHPALKEIIGKIVEKNVNIIKDGKN